VLKIVFATNNQNKLKEARAILTDFEILSQEEAGFFDEVIEDGESFSENALKKATAVSLFTNKIVIADDSGICVHALGGAPGIYSARWSGEGDEANNEKLLRELEGERDRSAHFHCSIALVWPLRAGVSGDCAESNSCYLNDGLDNCYGGGRATTSRPYKITDSFDMDGSAVGTPRTASPTNFADSFVFEAEWHGEIADGARGENGFGYDFIFIPDGYDKTSAELTPEEKNRISHRYLALMKLKKFLEEMA